MVAFSALKSALKNLPVLAYPRLGEPFKLYTDASATHIGAVLNQDDENDIERAVAHWSKVLNRHQMNYAVSEREYLALVAAVHHLRVYLIRNKWTVYAAYKALLFILEVVKPRQPLASRLERWTVVRQEYTLEIKYRPGTQTVHADALSLPNQELETLKEREAEFRYVHTITDDGAIMVKKRKEAEAEEDEIMKS